MGKLAGFWEKLKGIKHKELLLCGAAIAIVLAIYFSGLSCSRNDDAAVTSAEPDDYCSNMRAQVETIVSEISGVGSASVVINWDRAAGSSFGTGGEENPRATGVLVVCDGGNNTKVKLDVIYAVSTLLDLSIDKIMVYPKSN